MNPIKPDSKQAMFIAGPRAPSMDPADLQRRLKAYLKHEARLADIVRQTIFRTPLIKPKAQLDRFVRTYKPGRPAAYEESEIRMLVVQVGDLVGDFNDAVETFEQVSKLFADQKALGARDSLVVKTAEECVAYLSKTGASLKKTVAAVHVPKANGKPETTLKDVYAATSVLITAAMLVAEVSRKIVKWQAQQKKDAAS